MGEIRTEEHYIAFIDLLGAKEIISEDTDNKRLNEIRNIYTSWKSVKDASYFAALKIKFFSDNVVVAVKTSNSGKAEADVFLEFTAYMAEHLLKCNYKPRGGICKGQLYIDDIFVWGKGLVDAYRMESREAVYPRIIVAPEVLDGASKHLKDSMIEEDGTDGKFILNYLKSFGKAKNSWISDIAKVYASTSAEIEALQQAPEETENLKKSPEYEKVTEKKKILEKLRWLQAFEKRNLEFWNQDPS